MMDEKTELKYLIALTMVPAIGPVTARKLIDKVGSARAVFQQKRRVLESIEGIGPVLSRSINEFSLLGEAEREMEFMERHHIQVLYYKDPGFPYRLNECRDGPVLLYMRGDRGLQCSRCLSVVGTRRASPYGKEVCREIIRDLSLKVPDLSIISGLAYGIDVIAHRAALEFGLHTVAVLGHGLSTIYPHSHRETAKKIISQGALITDFHSGMGPERNNFIRRNRIIAGLSPATLVVESARKGGALITADMAFGYDREVLSVPGRVWEDRSIGTNTMIKDEMATMVESGSDIIRKLKWDDENSDPPHAAGMVNLTNEEQKLLIAIEEIPDITPGTLSELVHIALPNVLAMLLEMELKEWITAEPGNRYRTRISIV
ncbi:MAG: DNA-protecting protein DprA [Bacteroidetes bacterium]|nr:DNA-protecting protein DprA [Bacteroidota bacterium]